MSRQGPVFPARARGLVLSPGSRRAARPAPVVRLRRRPEAQQARRRCARRASSRVAAAQREGAGRAEEARGTHACARRQRSTPARGAPRSPQRGRRTGAPQRRRVDPRQSRRRRGRARAQPLHRRKAVRRRESRSRRSRDRRSRPRTPRPRAAAGSPPRPARPRGRVLLDEDEVGTGGERLPHAHARLDALRLGRGGHRADQRLLALGGRERGRSQRERGPSAQCRAQLGAGDEDACHDTNVCSTRTRVRCQIGLRSRRNGLCSRRNLGRQLDGIAERERGDQPRERERDHRDARGGQEDGMQRRCECLLEE